MPFKIGIAVIVLILASGVGLFFWSRSSNQQIPSFVPSSSQQTNKPQEQKQVFNTLPSLIQTEYADGVTEEDKKFIIQGISAMDFYLQKWFGKSIHEPAGLKVDAIENNTPGSGAKVEIQNGKMVILIGTKSWIWKQQVQINQLMGGDSHPHISAHEYVHVYQLNSGCGDVSAQSTTVPKWFVEGEAEWLAYKVTQEAGWVPTFSIPQMLIQVAKQETNTLKSHEHQGELSPASYSFYTMAVDYLMKDKPLKSLDDFCANIGNKKSLPEAFENAFGLPLDKFYENFESYRKTWSSQSPGQGQIPQQYCTPFAILPSCSYVGAPDSQNYKYCKQCYPNK